MISNSTSVLGIGFGPPIANFGSRWSSSKARRFWHIKQTTNLRILCFNPTITYQNKLLLLSPSVLFNKQSCKRIFWYLFFLLNASASYVFWSFQMSLDEGGLKIVELLPIKLFFPGPSQTFGWVGPGRYAPLNIPNIFKAAGINTKWIPEVTHLPTLFNKPVWPRSIIFKSI